MVEEIHAIRDIVQANWWYIASVVGAFGAGALLTREHYKNILRTKAEEELFGVLGVYEQTENIDELLGHYSRLAKIAEDLGRDRHSQCPYTMSEIERKAISQIGTEAPLILVPKIVDARSTSSGLQQIFLRHRQNNGIERRV